MMLLIASGYALYYSDEGSRPVISVLVWHVLRGRGTRSTSDQHLTATEKLETSDDLVGPH